ncbi:hypothetical protein [Hydrogenophaga soli]
MEHAVPEQFWVDKSQCRYVDEAGQIQNPTLADCAQGVSAVKALAIAQAEGQRIYTITAENAATALPNLPVGGSVGNEIRSAVQAGKEVTVHERAINAHGFSGYGYIVTDPDTGGGGYLIEGRGNGGILYTDMDEFVLELQIGCVLVQGVSLKYLSPQTFAIALSSMIGSLVGYVTSVAALGLTYSPDKLCLTKDQGAALAAGITALGVLGQYTSFAPPFAPTLGVMLGLILILEMMIHFVRMNQAIGDCI